MSQPALLLCTVGGSSPAVAAAIKGCRPERIVFVVSPETHGQLAENILPLLRGEGIEYSPGQYEVSQVPDAQDLASCIEKVKELDSEVEKWLGRGADYRVVVDFTGGTKLMSAALALAAHRWRCTFSYVGGSERNRNGTGIVINGKEEYLCTPNPWELLGYQALEDAVVLFDSGDYEAAVGVLQRTRNGMQRPDLKDEMNTVLLLAEAYHLWDLFRHEDALMKLNLVIKGSNDLRHALGLRSEGLLSQVRLHVSFLEQVQGGKPGEHVVVDLLANARRCAVRGRWDDAVARLYRAAEAAAQTRLHGTYDMYFAGSDGTPNFGKLALAKVPEPLRTEWSERATEGYLSLGLQEDYRLLSALGDDLGKRFAPLKGRESPLSARNQSILAHGFTPVGEKVFHELWKHVLALTGATEEVLPEFPTLGCSQYENRQNS